MHPASRVQSDSKGAVDGTSPPRGPVFVHRLVRVWSFSTGCGSCGARTRVGGQCGWMRSQLAFHATNQFGLITREQVLAAGLSEGEIRRLTRPDGAGGVDRTSTRRTSSH